MNSTDNEATRLLQQKWGFDAFRPGQEAVIASLLAGHSAAAVFPTGGGKSLCYQLPALLLNGLTLVVSPLIALMKDQIDALAARDVRAGRIDSSLSRDELRQVMADIHEQRLKLLYVAPERFNNERFRESLTHLKIALFAVDEAHCISEWGHNFRPDYLKLVQFARDYRAERVLALTATATPEVLADICRQFDIAPEHSIRTAFYRENLTLLTETVDADHRDALLLERMRSRPPGATIVYVTRQKTAEDVASQLARAGYDAVPYHAGMSPEKRSHVQEGFMRGRPSVVVATIAFGMGIDKANIRYVYHYNYPKSIEGYSQEIGRAGRDGERSICEVMACASDAHVLANFAHGDTPSETCVKSLLESLFRLVDVGDQFDVSYYDLANTYDIRMLVVRTLLTYLELDGWLASSTPFYQSYRFKALTSSKEILASLDEPRRGFVRRLLAQSKKARTWFTIDVDAAVAALDAQRADVVAALDDLHDQGFIELATSGMRQPLTVLKLPPSIDALARDLHARTLQREQREIARLEQVFALLSADTCLASRLGAHFGEPLHQPCGHCTVCLHGPQPKAATPRLPSDQPDETLLRAVRDLTHADTRYARALSEPRAIARFLCGLSSPLTTRARLSRHQLFGSCDEVPFAQVLARLEAT